MTTTLRQVLNIFEENQQPIALSRLAVQLDTPQPLLEGMLDYWVRKGKLRVASGHQDCGSCAKDGDCAFVVDIPRSYELATQDQLLTLDAIPNQCDFEPLKPKS